MRLSGIVDDNEQYNQRHGPGGNVPPDSSQNGAPTGPPMGTPVETPGPAANPQGDQGGAAPQTPRATGQGVGLEASGATGGLAGSFAQVGNSNFAQRFGGDNPAVWFRNFGKSKQDELANAGRGNVGGVGNSGGSIPSEGPIGGPSLGEKGGNKSDEEWQRFMTEVSRMRFGRGGA